MSGPNAHLMFPGLRRNMVTICAMTATIMQALDTTIANVALPYMQGTLSASQDQINWVLTSYIVAAAIMTAPVGWIANRFGRKRIFIICSAGFTMASVLCGLAQDINQMVLFRLLQGVFGAALVPLSQSVMLDYYTLQERAKAMSIWGMGVMMGPIMGPSLGAWLTETYSWHWVFFVNLTRPGRISASDSTGSVSPRWRLRSARCSSRSTEASNWAGWNPMRSSRSSSSRPSPSTSSWRTPSRPRRRSSASRCSGIATSSPAACSWS
jgi:MFS family permease